MPKMPVTASIAASIPIIPRAAVAVRAGNSTLLSASSQLRMVIGAVGAMLLKIRCKRSRHVAGGQAGAHYQIGVALFHLSRRDIDSRTSGFRSGPNTFHSPPRQQLRTNHSIAKSDFPRRPIAKHFVANVAFTMATRGVVRRRAKSNCVLSAAVFPLLRGSPAIPDTRASPAPDSTNSDLPFQANKREYRSSRIRSVAGSSRFPRPGRREYFPPPR